MDEISLLQPDKLMTGTHTHLFETAIGTCGIAWTERGIAQLQLPEKDRAATEHRLQTVSYTHLTLPTILRV